MSVDFEGRGLKICGLTYLSPKEALSFLEDDAVLVDLRDGLLKNGRYFRVKNLIDLPFRDLENEFRKLPRDKNLILADYVGLKSKEALKFLSEKGYTKIASLIGGILDWEHDGMPMSKNVNEELTGGCACQLRPRNAKMKNILFVCIHNSARSQMAETFLNSLALENVKAESAGIEKASLNPLVVEVMKELGIDISGNRSKTVIEMIEAGKKYDYVITVCDQASGERCPVFPGHAYKRLHFEFDDPSKAEGSHEEKLSKIRVIRDEIMAKIKEFTEELTTF